MSVPRVLHAVVLLLLRGGFPGAASDTVTLKEGENLNLRCTFSTLSDSSSALQWSDPRGFTIFLNAQRVLRDQRYKLLRYSKEELSIQLPNVTVQDEGVYRCFQYGRHIKSQSQNVEILAAPSPPVLEVSRDAGGAIELSCSTQGCKPQPQISWLLDNGIELPGDTRHQLGADGKKWSTSSTLRVLSSSPKATASCSIQHPALRGHQITASFPFQDLPITGSKQPTRLSENPGVPSPSENPGVPSPLENPAVPSPSENPAVPSPSASQKYPAVPSPSTSQKDPAVPSPSTSQKVPAVPSSAPTPAQQNPTAAVTSDGTETAPGRNGTGEEQPRTEGPAPPENRTVISILTLGQNPQSKGTVKDKKNFLLPVLVAALIFLLLLIVLLFLVKLKKAHGMWKRENDVSEQTLESYKSRSNEDSPGHEKNRQAVNPKSNVPYVTEGYVGTPEKNLETTEKNPGDKNIVISEKMFKCGKETDV